MRLEERIQSEMKPQAWQYLLAGLYTWMISVFCGAVLLDIVYSNLVSGTDLAFEAGEIFSEGADFPLLRWLQGSLGVNLGPWIRLSASGLASILAFLGLWKLCSASHVRVGM